MDVHDEDITTKEKAKKKKKMNKDSPKEDTETLVFLESPLEGGGTVGVEEDEAEELIKLALEEWPELIQDVGSISSKQEDLVIRFNKVTKRKKKSPGSKSKASSSVLKCIMQKVYQEAVSDPQRLNRYPPFSPSVYGETSFEFICKMVSQISISKEDVFLDLGSGVGQVVLQMAASTDCRTCIGIEKEEIPLMYSDRMAESFEKWMAWFGKSFKPYQLLKGNFLQEVFKDKIFSATIIFVNNWAFGPEVDHKLKQVFADLQDGVRIISSKAFCPLNFRITTRSLSDIGSILFVSELGPCRRAVSWTGNLFSYYLHVVDRTKLENFFQRAQKRLAQAKCKKKKLKKGEEVLKKKKGDEGEEEEEMEEEEEEEDEEEEEEAEEETIHSLGVGVTTRRAWSEYCKKKEKENSVPGDPKSETKVSKMDLSLNALLETYRKQMIRAVNRMKTEGYREAIEQEIIREREKKAELLAKSHVLEKKIEILKKEGVAMLKEKLTAFEVTTPEELVNIAQNLVEENRELTLKAAQLENEIASLTTSSFTMISNQLATEFATRNRLCSLMTSLSEEVNHLESSLHHQSSF